MSREVHQRPAEKPGPSTLKFVSSPDPGRLRFEIRYS